MIADDVVARKARLWARDYADDRDLSDAEQECLRDLLKSDEVFGQVLTAQQNAARLASGGDEIMRTVVEHTDAAASELGEALDLIMDERVQEAREIVALAEAVDDLAPWGIMVRPYQAGFETVEDLQEASQDDLINVGMNRSVAAKVKAAVGESGGGF